ncbi:CrcB family protein [Tahibacter amnicola]|uniref:Fluoride-specific ion channel FluC n=1 Tax=Tahibacter amnicola TaxID=2976241 RepID=A0ABY6BCG6_9GAMM|nr:CrcB family protein [Tahibacter amnicola]UXI66311.1 CrcB family protein [Tahibacter amnicola]
MNALSVAGIFAGAGLGALLRWALNLALNPVFPTLPLGTLAANTLGGLLTGLIMGFVVQFDTLPAAVRLALTTGFLGGLTTFSAFSAETSALLLRAEYRWVCAIITAHVGMSLLATLTGVGLVRWLLRS